MMFKGFQKVTEEADELEVKDEVEIHDADAELLEPEKSDLVTDVNEIIAQLKTFDKEALHQALLSYDVLGIEKPSKEFLEAILSILPYDEFVVANVAEVASDMGEEVLAKEEPKVESLEEKKEEKHGFFKKVEKE